MRFEFASAGRVVFGEGCLKEAGLIALEFGKRALVVTGRNTARADTLISLLCAQGIESVSFQVTGEPTTKSVEDGARLGRDSRSELVIGFGGGSAVDTGKAIAAMLANPGDLMDHHEVIGRAKPLANPSVPYIAIPTTAGTGSEVTRNAVLASAEHGVKVSLRSPFMLPRVALVDPELTYDLPPALTAATGLDALTQVIEPYVSSRANPLVDAICQEGIQRGARSLRLACTNGKDPEARHQMCLTSLFGGFALANAGLGAVHGFAGPIGGMFPAPHGAVCAVLLAPVTRMNLRALKSRQPGAEALNRYRRAAQWLTGREGAIAEDAVPWLADLVRDLAIPPLSTYGLTRGDIPDLVEKAAKASSMKANPITLQEDELSEILQEAL